ncbi:Insulin-like growth factor-binding protein complex acid labile subunit [Anthophora quadrimaculata]
MKTGRKMKILAALQLLTVVVLVDVVSSNIAPSTTNAKDGSYSVIFHEYNTTGTTESSKKSPLKTNNASEVEPYATISSANDQIKDKSSSAYEKVMRKLEKYDDLLLKPILSPKDMFLQEIHTLSEEASTAKINEDLAQKKKVKSLSSTSTAPPAVTVVSVNNTTEDSATKKLFENEDAPYEDDLSEDEEDENDEEYYDPDVAQDDEEESESDEQVMTQCPDYCRCAGEYAAATTATCSKLVDHQSFNPSIVHLHIENAGQIRLGPHAFQSWGLQQIESITISDTKIVELNQTAFDGISSLFSVNLTRNDLQDIHPNTFQSNKQLSLLAISGNPLKYSQDLKSIKHGLIDAPLVTEFDFSFNGLTKLKRTAFSKMQRLTYLNLKGNKLKEIDNTTFNTLYALEEVNLSNNLLNEIPVGLLENSEIQTLRITDNNLVSLSTVQAPKLRLLDASNNKIKLITKDDLSGVPLLEQLTITSNGIKRIHQHSFAHLDHLTHLDISGNKLTSLTEHHLRANSRLQVLLMNDNPIETLPVFKTFGLEYNTFSVYRFECSNCGLYLLQKGTFDAMPAITRLNLSKNRLIDLPDGLLNSLLYLRVLDLSDNIISVLDNNMFRGATSLTKLNLAGNPLVTLQVTPFLMAPSLTKLDVSRCSLERVWSEARVPLTSLRSLSVRDNLLRRITVEELKATPKLVSLDLSRNPLDCDVEFNEAIQWLTDYGVTPFESSSYISNYGNNDNYQDSEGISQWTELAKVVCDDINDGPPDRTISHKEKKPKAFLAGLDTSEDSDSLIKNIIESDEELLKLQIDHGIKLNEEVEKAWTSQDQEYEDFVASNNTEHHPWYANAFWPVVIVIIVTLMILLLTVHVAIHLAKRRGHGPVIRPPMILRQGFIDNKNCGLVYKPLQEDIATPHVPKRGSFYSSSTFHYDKIVPESV